MVNFPAEISEENGYSLIRNESELGHYSRSFEQLVCDYRRVDSDGETLDQHVTIFQRDI